MPRINAFGFSTRSRRMARYFPSGIDRLEIEQSGGVAITFALALIPMTLAVGAAVDYSFASSARAHLNAVADAAALSAVDKPSLALSKSDAEKNALGLFNAQAENIKRVSLKTVSVTIKEDATKGRSAIVKYTATSAASFMGLIGVKTLNIAGDSM